MKRLWFNYKLMRAYNTTKAIALAKAILLCYGQRVYMNEHYAGNNYSVYPCK